MPSRTTSVAERFGRQTVSHVTRNESEHQAHLGTWLAIVVCVLSTVWSVRLESPALAWPLFVLAPLATATAFTAASGVVSRRTARLPVVWEPFTLCVSHLRAAVRDMRSGAAGDRALLAVTAALLTAGPISRPFYNGTQTAVLAPIQGWSLLLAPLALYLTVRRAGSLVVQRHIRAIQNEQRLEASGWAMLARAFSMPKQEIRGAVVAAYDIDRRGRFQPSIVVRPAGIIGEFPGPMRQALQDLSAVNDALFDYGLCTDAHHIMAREIHIIESLPGGPVHEEIRARREVLALTDGLLVALQPVEAPRETRPEEEVGSLAPGITESRAEEVDHILYTRTGLSLVEWDKGARTVALARLGDESRRARADLARVLEVRPWDVDVRFELDDDGLVNDVHITREPFASDPIKRASKLKGAVRDLWRPPVAGDPRRWVIGSTKSPWNEIRLCLKPDLLVEAMDIAAFEDQYRAGVDPKKPWLAYPIARREDGGAFSYSLFHTLVIGQTGAGKGSVMWSLISGLLPAVRDGLIELYAIDPKAAEATMAPNLFKQIATTPDDWAPLLESLVEDMKRRQAQRAGFARETAITRATPGRVLVVDEASALGKFDTDTARAKTVNQNLLLLASQGRSEGYTIILMTQGPQKDLVGEVREFMALRIALRTATVTETELVLSKAAVDAGAAAHEIEPANKGNGYRTAGTAYMQADGDPLPARIRFPYTSDDDLKRWNDEYKPVIHHEGMTFSLAELEND